VASLDATQRTIIERPVTISGDGRRIAPNTVLCAEPSPDVATAIAASFSMTARASGLEPNSGSQISGAGAAARSLAQLVAQLGPRTTTVQLLRDVLFRACEAYANGALNVTAYAQMLGRFDAFAATLMLGEVAGGAFGGSLAALQTGTNASTSPPAPSSGDTTALAGLQTRQSTLTREIAELATRREQLGPLIRDAASDTDRATLQDEQRTNQASLNGKRAELATVNQQIFDLQSDGAQAGARGLGIAGGTTPRLQDAQVAQQLRLMLREYLQHVETDRAPLVTACVSFLDGQRKEQGAESSDQSMCRRMIEGLGLALVDRTWRAPPLQSPWFQEAVLNAGQPNADVRLIRQGIEDLYQRRCRTARPDDADCRALRASTTQMITNLATLEQRRGVTAPPPAGARVPQPPPPPPIRFTPPS
jgi:hypothetical protein